MLLPKVIAVDGPASSGKSSISSAIAREMGYLFVDTGAFYRAVTLAILEADALGLNDAGLVEFARRANLDVTPGGVDEHHPYTIWLDGRDVTAAVRDARVEARVSRIAAIPGIRAALNAKYRELAARGPVIMAGRDIGTVVLPDADLKIYLDASPEARARRRYDQLVAAGQAANYDLIRDELVRRDREDSRQTLRAPDAEYLVTDNLDEEAAVQAVRQLILNWQPA